MNDALTYFLIVLLVMLTTRWLLRRTDYRYSRGPQRAGLGRRRTGALLPCCVVIVGLEPTPEVLVQETVRGIAELRRRRRPFAQAEFPRAVVVAAGTRFAVTLREHAEHLTRKVEELANDSLQQAVTVEIRESDEVVPTGQLWVLPTGWPTDNDGSGVVPADRGRPVQDIDDLANARTVRHENAGGAIPDTRQAADEVGRRADEDVWHAEEARWNRASVGELAERNQRTLRQLAEDAAGAQPSDRREDGAPSTRRPESGHTSALIRSGRTPPRRSSSGEPSAELNRSAGGSKRFSQLPDRSPTLRRRPALWLHPLDGLKAVENYGLPASGGQVSQGASKDANHPTVVVPSPQVSSPHCEIRPTERGGWVVRDLASRNGTYVDDVKVDRETPLCHGQVLGLGRAVRLRFLVGDAQLKTDTMPHADGPRSSAEVWT